MKTIKSLMITFLLLSSFLALAVGCASAEGLTISQDRSIGIISPGGTAKYNFTVTNPSEIDKTVSILLSDAEAGISVNITPGLTFDLAPGETENVSVSITVGSNVPGNTPYTIEIEFNDNRGFSDSFEVIATVEEVYEFSVSSATGFELDVQTESWCEYTMTLYNIGNVADNYSIAISDQNEIVGSRVFNQSTNWTILTHSSQGVHDVDDNIDYIGSLGILQSRTFFIDVEPSAYVLEDTVFRFNLTMTSIGSLDTIKTEFITTVVDNPYNVSLSLLSSNESTLVAGEFVDYDFSVTGSDDVSETVTINILGNLWAVENGWEYLLIDDNESILGGYYQEKAVQIGGPGQYTTSDINDAWSEKDDVTSAGHLTNGYFSTSTTNSYGKYTIISGDRNWTYDPGLYEHPYTFTIPANTTMNFTLRINAPESNELAPAGTEIHCMVVASVNEKADFRLGFSTTSPTEGYRGVTEEGFPTWVIYGIVAAIVIIAVVGVAGMLLSRRNFEKGYRLPKSGKCNPGDVQEGKVCYPKK